MPNTNLIQAAIVVSRDEKIEGLTLLNKALLLGCKVVSMSPFGMGGATPWAASLVVIEGPIGIIEDLGMQKNVS